MLTQTPLQEQILLLLAQREQLCDSRYVGQVSLKLHDTRLLKISKILLHNTTLKTVLDHQYLYWLTNTQANLPELFSFSLQPRHMAFFWQLKCHLHQICSANAVIAFLTENPEHTLCWQLVQYSPDIFASKFETLPAASAPIELISIFREQYMASAKAPTTLTALLYEASFSNKPLNVVQAVAELAQQQALSFESIALLIMQATTTEQMTIINQLTKLDDLRLALYAMAISGQQKYLPVLLELTQDAILAEIAADSLSIALGVLVADALIADGMAATDPEYLHQAYKTSGAIWSATTVNMTDLAFFWQQGNQLQRQLAAIKAAQVFPTLPVLNFAAFGGGQWHSV